MQSAASASQTSAVFFIGRITNFRMRGLLKSLDLPLASSMAYSTS